MEYLSLEEIECFVLLGYMKDGEFIHAHTEAYEKYPFQTDINDLIKEILNESAPWLKELPYPIEVRIVNKETNLEAFEMIKNSIKLMEFYENT